MQVENRLVFQLMIPALGVGGIDPFVPGCLNLFRIGVGTHNPEIDFKCIHAFAVFAVKTGCQISDAGIGPVFHNQVGPFQVFGGIHVLADGQRHITDGSGFVHKRQGIDDAATPGRGINLMVIRQVF